MLFPLGPSRQSWRGWSFSLLEGSGSLALPGQTPPPATSPPILSLPRHAGHLALPRPLVPWCPGTPLRTALCRLAGAPGQNPTAWEGGKSCSLSKTNVPKATALYPWHG